MTELHATIERFATITSPKRCAVLVFQFALTILPQTAELNCSCRIADTARRIIFRH